jgi:hypothetical protein
MTEPDDVPHVLAHAEIAVAGAGAGPDDSQDSEGNDGMDIQHAD